MSVKELQRIISPKFTEAVVFDIIKKKSGLRDVAVEKITMGEGSKKGDSYLSDICRFTVDASGKDATGQKQTVSFPVIVKYLPKNLGRRKTYRSTTFFKNEVIFYEKVWSVYQKFQDSKQITEKFDNIPLVLSALIDGQNDYVAMLDVSFDGYRSIGRGSGLDYEHAVVILKLLAGFHGLGLAIKDQQPEVFEAAASSLLETYFSEELRSWYGNFQEKLFDIYRDAVGKELPPLYLDKLNELIANDLYGELCKSCKAKGPLSVVTHGDVWVPNFLMKYAGDKLKHIIMIDFQLTRYSTIATDLTFFLYSCVDFTVMETQWENLLAEYHRTLINSLEKFGSERSLVTLEALHSEFKAHMAFGIGMSMEALVMSHLEDDDVSDLDAIEGDEAVPLESVWLVHPFKEQVKRKRLANMIKFAVDKNLI